MSDLRSATLTIEFTIVWPSLTWMSVMSSRETKFARWIEAV